MTKRQAKYLARLEFRASVLRTRIAAGMVQDLSEEKAELVALEWAVEELKKTCS